MKLTPLLSSTLIVLGFASNAHAIAINSTFALADKTGSSTYTITNTTDDRIFLNVVMYEFSTKNGDLIKTAYTRDNINDWKIEVKPPRAVINPGFEKDFRVSMKCKSNCDHLTDQAFQIGFIPTPYVAEGEHPEKLMQIAVGFGANFIKTGKEEPLNFTTMRNGNTVNIYNKSQAMLTALLSTCQPNTTTDEKKSCEQKVNVISGRNYPVTLQKTMQNKPVKITLTSVNNTYKETVTLAP